MNPQMKAMNVEQIISCPVPLKAASQIDHKVFVVQDESAER